MDNFNLYHPYRPFVDSILEIRLCQDTWKKVQQVARIKNSSYSWVVRYALFRLIKRSNMRRYLNSLHRTFGRHTIQETDKLLVLNEFARQRRFRSDLKHRHRLCLYGADEVFIRLAAAQMGCTMTHLVRLALEFYLDRMLGSLGVKSRARQAFWYWLGIKVTQDVEFHTLPLPKRYIHLHRYPKWEYF